MNLKRLVQIYTVFIPIKRFIEMKILDLNFENGLFLAPMAGVTNVPFRLMCKKYGAEGVFTEMISSRALCYNDKKTYELAKIDKDEHPCFLQIFGNEPETMAKAAALAMQFSPDGIDINMGCPAPKIAGNGDGSALMKNPSLCHDIVKAVKDALSGKNIPVSVKIRSGFDKQSINAVEVALLCEKAGADFITVHGRTREQMYAPYADRKIIADVKKAVSVPVIANGDIQDAESAMRMFDETGCDGIMIGRGALGNPYVFDEIRHALGKVPYTRPSREDIYSDICSHMTMLAEEKGEFIGSCEARKHIAWYLKGIPGAAGFRNEVNRVSTLDEVLEVAKKALLG